MNNEELKIKRIVVSRRQKYSFIYFESQSLTPINALDYSNRKAQEAKNNSYEKHDTEYYVIFGDHYITPKEYDDGYAVIKGEIVKLENAKVYCRYLTPFNFLITYKMSPINGNEFQKNEILFDNILDKKATIEQMITFVESLKMPI